MGKRLVNQPVVKTKKFILMINALAEVERNINIVAEDRGE